MPSVSIRLIASKVVIARSFVGDTTLGPCSTKRVNEASEVNRSSTCASFVL